MAKMKTLDHVAIILLLIGGLVWLIEAVAYFGSLLLSLFTSVSPMSFNVVAWLFAGVFGMGAWVENLVYALVGAATVYAIVRYPGKKG